MSTTSTKAPPRHNIPAGKQAWTAAEDAILHAGYREHGVSWCRDQMPHRTAAAIQQRATKIRASSAGSARPEHSERAAARIKANAERARLRRLHQDTWQAPAPRYPSVWAMAQELTA